MHLLNVINLCNLYRFSFCLYIVCSCSHLNSCTYYVIIGVCSIQHYVIQFVSDLRQVGGFLRVLRFPPPIKLTATIKLK